MIEITLGVVIVALVLLFAWERRETRKEQSKLINALVSKTPEQLRDLEYLDKMVGMKEEVEEDPYISPEQLTDEQWLERVTGKKLTEEFENA